MNTFFSEKCYLGVWELGAGVSGRYNLLADVICLFVYKWKMIGIIFYSYTYISFYFYKIVYYQKYESIYLKY